ncbi:MAG: succinyl-CoA synthetase, partial [Desulfovibrionaceae bacterium]|nr:succinyl-CoA synthetase [Desulfovibrionaceae bacterium]
NKDVIARLGLTDEAVDAATASDLMVCIEAETEAAVKEALASVQANLKAKAGGAQATETKPATLEEGADSLEDANFCMISLPGPMAKLDCICALERGLNVMLFSDNISLEDERELKEKAIAKDLLLMGPDCGTAIVAGVPLALANVIRRGDIGIVAASGTGIQEVTCLIDRFGGGITHALGCGGRDLRKEIGGLEMRFGIKKLAATPGNKTLLLLSKPGDPAVLNQVLDAARATGLRTVTCLIGGKPDQLNTKDIIFTSTLEEAAFAALGQPIPELVLPADFAARINGLDSQRKYLRGLFSGGTLCYEALVLLDDKFDIESNVPLRKELFLEAPTKGKKHCCVDLGEDEFTRGIPHPIIDTGLRGQRLEEDMRDPTCRVIMMDIVLGYGADPAPGEKFAQIIKRVKKDLPDGGPIIVASVCGTDADPQSCSQQENALTDAGVFVFPTNAQAAKAACKIVLGN